MRLDEFLHLNDCPAVPVDRYAECVVEVELPPDWEPFQAVAGMRMWAWRNDPQLQTFCANAVLTMHLIPASLDPAAVFTMLSDLQVQSVPGCHERRRELEAAADGPGIQGWLASQFVTEFGVVDSVSQSRILPAGQATAVIQLTVTALHDCPMDRSAIRLRVKPPEHVPLAAAVVPHAGSPEPAAG